mmetsp:Transcript_11607/g.10379  ORF Transcript_11607/g.10379 Transcript_11607/m.10379 type:complete len:137 (-) Transcript_11607:175-585(-)
MYPSLLQSMIMNLLFIASFANKIVDINADCGLMGGCQECLTEFECLLADYDSSENHCGWIHTSQYSQCISLLELSSISARTPTPTVIEDEEIDEPFPSLNPEVLRAAGRPHTAPFRRLGERKNKGPSNSHSRESRD